MYRYDYELKYSDFKNFDIVKTSAIIDLIQEAAIRHSEFSGYGLENLRKMGLAWLLQGINIRFHKPVTTEHNVEVYTAVKCFKGVISERGCRIFQNGELVAESIANWCLLDTEKMRLSRISKEMASCYEHYDFNDEFFTYVRPNAVDACDVKYKIRISNKEIDTNKHLNNQKGAELLMDALPFDFEIRNIKIHYPGQAYLGDEMSVCVKEIENGYYVHLEKDDKTVCVAGTFENK